MKVSSLLSFLVLSLLIIACSSKKDESELYNSAKKSLENQKYYEALVTYNELLNDYPNGTHAAETIFELGKLNHGKVDTTLNEMQSFEKAVTFYTKLQKDYPEYEKSSEALFMASFVLANEIKDLERAEASYNLFIEKYPNSELVESAKIELENLGVAPEEILRKKVATDN